MEFQVCQPSYTLFLFYCRLTTGTCELWFLIVSIMLNKYPSPHYLPQDPTPNALLVSNPPPYPEQLAYRALITKLLGHLYGRCLSVGVGTVSVVYKV